MLFEGLCSGVFCQADTFIILVRQKPTWRTIDEGFAQEKIIAQDLEILKKARNIQWIVWQGQ
jgi:hypothetical protein